MRIKRRRHSGGSRSAGAHPLLHGGGGRRV